ncbi:high-affinity choline transporter 1 [Aplysia californica]|uniref:High-affinity choline transporter 1 n=1 Tax=Aplysia californica TaxID=6500 RepID=A0ABM1ACP2_APLCA|nr:high-affinity choline transporter 1 [Aplysia californica]
MALNVVAVVILVIFYLAIVVVGLVAAWKVKVKGQETGGLESSVVAGRDLKTFVAIFTMIATTVGGGYINGTAESVAQDGLVWTLAPLGIFLGLNIGGALYARKMRERQYLTMLDPFQHHYGNVVALLLYLASLMGDLLWTASILNALGTTLSVIANIPLTVAVVVSGAVTLSYTVVGSMVSVAYTDIVQLLFIALGLVVSLPFVLSDDRIGDMWATRDIWVGQLPAEQAGVWADLLVAMTLGTIPWQSYFQRVLSVRTARQAQVLSFVGAVGAAVLVIPAVVLGIAGTSADWSNTTLGQSPPDLNLSSLTLPLVINEFSPEPVSILGLGAISAAVMSSMDSAVLGTSSMFTHNIYSCLLRSSASNRELRLVQIVSIVFFGAVAMAIALWSSVIYGVFILAADIVFVIIFPQLTAVLYLPKLCNSVGAVAGYLVGLVLRIGAGEPIINMPVWLRFFIYDEAQGKHLFPFRTFSMLVSLAVTLAVSVVFRLASNWLRGQGYAVPCAVSTDAGDDVGEGAAGKDAAAGEYGGFRKVGVENCYSGGDGESPSHVGRNGLRAGSGEGYEMGSLMVEGKFRKLTDNDEDI